MEEKSIKLKQGIFISFEGNDGSGKSSTVKAVYEELVNRGYDVIITREPGGSKIAEKIRKVILDNDNVGMDERTESLLYAAARREHIVKVIKPALEEKKIVLCDRFIDSSLAYQGYARKIGIEQVYEMNIYATEGLMPDLTIFVSADPEIGIARIKRNARELDRLEHEEIEFHRQVYQGYLEVAKRFPERIVQVNGENTLDIALKQAVDVVLDFMKGK